MKRLHQRLGYNPDDRCCYWCHKRIGDNGLLAVIGHLRYSVCSGDCPDLPSDAVVGTRTQVLAAEIERTRLHHQPTKGNA